jgi:beta-lactamase superfamily II metal-dependent hydrolase
MGSKALKLHVLDVGHGDSLILEFPGGRAFGIIDCNRHKKSNRGFDIEGCNTNEPKALTFFQHRKAQSKNHELVVEFVCCTHAHADHYSGFGELLKGLQRLDIPIRRVWDFCDSSNKAEALLDSAREPEQIEQARELARFLGALEPLINSSSYRQLDQPIDRVLEIDGIVIDAIAPCAVQASRYRQHLLAKEKDRRAFRRIFGSYVADDNIVSSALSVRYGAVQLVLGGDVPNLGWQAVLKRKSLENCAAIKISHHGSEEGFFPDDSEKSLCEYLSSGKKRLIAMISGGYRCALPHPRTLRALKEFRSNIYCTGSLLKFDSRPYIPIGCPLDEEFARSHRIFEVDETDDSFHGNITLSCWRDGRLRVKTEFHKAPLSP